MEPQTVWSLLEQAGVSMAPLYLCSFVAMAMAVRKGVQFARDRIGDVSPLAVIGQPGDWAALVERFGVESPLARVLRVAARAAATDPARAEAAASRAAQAELDHYESGLSLLSYIAEAAPLFGLLGTVLGMIDLFSGMQLAGSAPAGAALASGIWKALLTTAAGLLIAIPTIGIHLWLSRRLELLQHRMESGVGDLLARAS